ncbi:hypothetical protein MP638_005192 [Amoeboaphelidium occidentale]|nr:hypothetical protein MP638_005192 [Amoeboaphelidium occidentale]
MFGRRKSGSKDQPAEASSEPEGEKKRKNSLKSFFGGVTGASASSSGDKKKEKPDTPIPSSSEPNDKDLNKILPPLCKAVYQDDLYKLKELVSKKKVDLFQSDKITERNLFHWIASAGRLEFLKAALETKNKDIPNAINGLDYEGRSPLCLAVINKHVEVLRSILNESTVSLNTADKKGKQPLYYAVCNDDIATCTILILRGANFNAKNEQGIPMLLEAIATGHIEAAISLINNNADLQIRDAQQRTPLHYAVLVGSLQLVKVLLARNCSPLDKDNEGKTSIDLADEKINQSKQQGKKNGAIELDDEKNPYYSIVNALRASLIKKERPVTEYKPSSFRSSISSGPSSAKTSVGDAAMIEDVVDIRNLKTGVDSKKNLALNTIGKIDEDKESVNSKKSKISLLDDAGSNYSAEMGSKDITEAKWLSMGFSKEDYEDYKRKKATKAARRSNRSNKSLPETGSDVVYDNVSDLAANKSSSSLDTRERHLSNASNISKTGKRSRVISPSRSSDGNTNEDSESVVMEASESLNRQYLKMKSEISSSSTPDPMNEVGASTTKRDSDKGSNLAKFGSDDLIHGANILKNAASSASTNTQTSQKSLKQTSGGGTPLSPVQSTGMRATSAIAKSGASTLPRIVLQLQGADGKERIKNRSRSFGDINLLAEGEIVFNPLSKRPSAQLPSSAIPLGTADDHSGHNNGRKGSVQLNPADLMAAIRRQFSSDTGKDVFKSNDALSHHSSEKSAHELFESSDLAPDGTLKLKRDLFRVYQHLLENPTVPNSRNDLKDAAEESPQSIEVEEVIRLVDQLIKDNNDLSAELSKTKNDLQTEKQHVKENSSKNVETSRSSLDKQKENETKLEEYEKENKNLRQQNQNLQDQVNNLTQTVREKEVALLDLETDLADEKDQVQQAIHEHNRVLRQYMDLRGQMDVFAQKSSEEVAKLQEALRIAESKQVDTAKMSTEQEKNNTKQDNVEVDILNKQLRSKDEEVVRLKRELFLAQTELEEKEKRWENELRKKSLPNTTAAKKIDELKEKVETKEKVYEEDVQKAKRGSKSSKANQDENSSNDSTPSQSLSSIHEETFSSKEQLYSELSAELTAMQTRLMNEIAVRKEKEHHLNTTLAHNEELQDEIAEKTKLLQDETQRLKEISLRATDIEVKFADLSEQARTEKVNAEKERSLRVKIQKEISDLESALKRANEALDREVAIRKNADQKLNALQAENENYKRELLKEKDRHEAKYKELSLLKSSNNSQEDYLIILKEQLEEERKHRMELTVENIDIKAKNSEANTVLLEIQELQKEQISTIETQKEQKLALEEALKKAEETVLDIEARMEQLQNAINNLRTRNKDLEFKHSLKVQEIERATKDISALKAQISALDAEKSKDKAEHVSAEKILLDARAKDKEEIKQLQYQLKDAASKLESKERALAQLSKDSENLKKEMNVQLTKAQQENSQEKSRHSQEIVDLNFQMEDLKTSLAESKQKEASLKNRLNEVETQLKDKSAQFDNLRSDFEKAKELIQKATSRVQKLETDIAEKKKTIEQNAKMINDLESEKEVGILEMVKLRQEIQQIQGSAKEADEISEAICKKLEESVGIESSSNMPVTQFRSRSNTEEFGNISIEGYLLRMDKSWEDVEEIFDSVKEFHQKQTSMVSQLDGNLKVSSKEAGIVQKTFKRVYQAFLNSLESTIIKRSLHQLNEASRKYNKLSTEVNAEIKRQLLSREAKDQEKQNSYQEKIQAIELQKRSLEERIADLKQSLHISQEQHQAALKSHEKEAAAVKKQVDELKDSLLQKERILLDSQVKIAKLDGVESKNERIQKDITNLEQQRSRQMQTIQLLEMENQVLKQELEDRDPEFVAEMDRPLQEEIMALKRQISGNEEGFTLTPNILRRTMTPRRSGSKNDKLNLLHQVQTLTTQVAALENEYKNAQKSWDTVKTTMEQGFQNERNDLIQALKTQQEQLEKIEKTFQRDIVKDVSHRDGKHSEQLVRIILDKLEVLQDMRIEMEITRQHNERRLREQYEREISSLVSQYDGMNSKLKRISDAYRKLTEENKSLKTKLLAVSKEQLKTQRIKEQIGFKLAEAKVLTGIRR